MQPFSDPSQIVSSSSVRTAWRRCLLLACLLALSASATRAQDDGAPMSIRQMMDLEKPLIQPAQVKQAPRKFQVQKSIWSGDITSDAKTYLRIQLQSMTIPANFERLSEIRSDLMRLIRSAGSRANPTVAKASKEELSEFVTAECMKLMDNNFFVRLNAVLIVTDLNIVEPQLGPNAAPAVPYSGAFAPLVDNVVADPNQPDAIKIHAAKGLHRILLFGELKDEEQIKVAKALVKELRDDTYHYWYQMRVAEALGAVDVLLPRPPDKQEPFVVQALSEALVDSDRHCLVRCEAAKALGRAPIDGRINMEMLVWQVANLAKELGTAYTKNQRDPKWKRCFIALYFAFKAIGPQEANAIQRPGFLAKAGGKKLVDEAFEHIKPISVHVLKQPVEPRAGGQIWNPLETAHLKNVGDWLQKYKPNDFRVAPTLAPNLPPITSASTGNGSGAVNGGTAQ